MKKKILSLLTAFAMVFGILVAPFTTASANTTIEPQNTKVNIHKILMDGDGSADPYKSWPDQGKEHDGSEITDIQQYFGNNAKRINGVAFRFYEVKDTQEDGFVKGDDASLADYDGKFEASKFYKLVKFDDQNIASPRASKEFVLTKNVDGDDGIAQVTLPKGTFRVVEDKANSTYDGNITGMKAVPFTLNLPAPMPDGTKNYDTKNILNVYPKNVEKKVQFDKNFVKSNKYDPTKTQDADLIKKGIDYAKYNQAKATAKGFIGKEYDYEAAAKAPKGTYFPNLVIRDSFDQGMEFVKDSLTVVDTLENEGAGQTKLTFTAGTDYTLEKKTSGFVLTFKPEGLKKINDEAKIRDVEIKLTYKGVVTKDAVVDKPIDNNVTVDFGHKNPPTPPSVKPSNGGLKVTKTWSKETEKASSVKYLLKDNNGKTVAQVELAGSETSGEKVAGVKPDGTEIKFIVTSAYSGKFTNLDNNTQYTIEEYVDGFRPDYAGSADGEVKIKNSKTPTTITPTPPKVVTGKKKFVKTDNTDSTKRLSGAQFVIERTIDGVKKYLALKDTTEQATAVSEYNTAEKNYLDAIDKLNKILKKSEDNRSEQEKTDKTTLEGEDTVQGSIKALKKIRDEKYKALNTQWKWITADEAKDNNAQNEVDKTWGKAFKFTSNSDGQFEVVGLEYGDGYSAIEIKAPVGYVIPSNPEFAFTVAKSDEDTNVDIMYEKTDAKNNAKEIKNIKSDIPKTGGIGSLIFIAAGLAIMTFAFVAYKRSEAVEA